MGKYENLRVFLPLIEGIIIISIPEKQMIESAYCDTRLVCENMTFDEFDKYFYKSVGIKMDKASLTDLRYLISVSDKKNTSMFIEMEDGSRARYQIKHVMNGERRIIYLENLSKKSEIFDRIDALTGVYNKAAMMDITRSLFEEPEKKPFSLIIIDIDDFKLMNDNFGHMFGDAVLQNFATTLKRYFNDSIIGRIGGDEFLVISFGPNDYQSVWERLHTLIAEIRKTDDFFDKKVAETLTLSTKMNKKFSLSITIGCSRYGIDGTDYLSLFQKADKALYRGKRKGKNCYIIYLDEKHKNIDVTISRQKNDFILDKKEFGRLMYRVLEILKVESSGSRNLENAIDLIGDELGFDRIRLLRYSNSEFKEYYEYKKNVDVVLDDAIIENDYTIWDGYGKSGVVALSMIESAKNNPKLYRLLDHNHIQSVVRILLRLNGKVVGEIYYEMLFEKKDWLHEEVQFLDNISNVLGIYLYRSIETAELLNSISKDDVTGLTDYMTFVTESTAKMTDNPDKYCIMFFNIRNFKYFNDLYGYRNGNYYLKSFSDALLEVFPQCNFTRSGADHFVGFAKFDNTISPNERFSNLSVLLNKKLNKINKDYKSIYSVGFYITDGIENDAHACIDNAKIAEESVVTLKGYGYKKFDSSLLNEYEERKEIEEHFAHALDNDEFEVFLQPKFDIKNNKFYGAEALSRWNFNHEYYLMPAKFIKILEDNKTITQLDYYVFKKVCMFIRKLMDDGIQLFPISVNLSREISNFDYYFENIEKIRNEYNVDSKWIEIEITESMFSNDNSIIIAFIDKLKSAGYSISMDDFGSGYSNLELLGIGSFDVLKLDKSLIDEISNEKKKTILSHVIGLANELHLQIICEGVEEQEEANVLEKMGCNKAQGYLYGRPVPIPEFEETFLK